MLFPGLRLWLKGTTVGATTDLSGKYSIAHVPETECKYLVYTYIGMENMEVGLEVVRLMDGVRWNPPVVGLSEVVVTALGIKREKREVTYQIQKVGSKNFLRTTNKGW